MSIGYIDKSKIYLKLNFSLSIVKVNIIISANFDLILPINPWNNQKDSPRLNMYFKYLKKFIIKL